MPNSPEQPVRATLRVRLPIPITCADLPAWCELDLDFAVLDQIDRARRVVDTHPHIVQITLRNIPIILEHVEQADFMPPHLIVSEGGYVAAEARRSLDTSAPLRTLPEPVDALAELLHHRPLPPACELECFIRPALVSFGLVHADAVELAHERNGNTHAAAFGGEALTLEEGSAILAGLRLLQLDLASDAPCVGADLNAVYTLDQQHKGLSTEKVDALCERIQGLPPPATRGQVTAARTLYAPQGGAHIRIDDDAATIYTEGAAWVSGWLRLPPRVQ